MQLFVVWGIETSDLIIKRTGCTIAAHRAREFFHEQAELRTELASDADEGELSDVLRFRSLENGLHQRTLAFHDEDFQRRVQRVVVLLDELRLKWNNADNEVPQD